MYALECMYTDKFINIHIYMDRGPCSWPPISSQIKTQRLSVMNAQP